MKYTIRSTQSEVFILSQSVVLASLFMMSSQLPLLCGAAVLASILSISQASPDSQWTLVSEDEPTDYCALLGEDDIQGMKHGFLAGNQVYYTGGTFLVQRLSENETIGLTHPFHHDLRSRGTGIATHEGVGTGNDFYGWEFHRETRVAYGSVVVGEERWDHPAPSHMYWRPDKMVVQYELTKDDEIVADVSEEKFISDTDVVSTTIRSDRPVMLEVTGQSYGSEKHIVSLDGQCTFNKDANSIQVLEAGRVTVKVSENPLVEKEGRLMYDGMTGVLSATRPFEEVELFEVRLQHLHLPANWQIYGMAIFFDKWPEGQNLE